MRPHVFTTSKGCSYLTYNERTLDLVTVESIISNFCFWISRYVELLFPSSPRFPFIKVKIQNKSNQPFQPSFPSRRCRHRQKTRNFLMSPLISQRLNKAFIHAPVKLSLKNSLGFRRKRKLFYLVCSRFSKM